MNDTSVLPWSSVLKMSLLELKLRRFIRTGGL